jgi:type II secretory pathway pseudopilin PulG
MLLTGKKWKMRGQKGSTLIEAVMSIAIVGILSTGFLTALINSTNTTASTDQKDTGRAIAQSQMEYVKEQKFSSSGYTPSDEIMTQYPGYTVNILVSIPEERDAFVQQITVNVVQRGKTVTTLEGFKTKR